MGAHSIKASSNARRVATAGLLAAGAA
ncbi:hydrolase, partial [Dietzia sp. SLG310A2-38A2]|nr:hydrolase [Dietzia sp. SLG310A2-38A2]